MKVDTGCEGAFAGFIAFCLVMGCIIIMALLGS
jgi:hypothetical protein